MPVLLPMIADPAIDLFIQSMVLRAAAIALPVGALVSPPAPIDWPRFQPVTPLAPGAISVSPMADSVPIVRVLPPSPMVSANGCIATSSGAILLFLPSECTIRGGIAGATERWALSGICRDSTGAPITAFACRVLVFETGQLIVGSPGAFVAETLSTIGSGAFSVFVPTNTAYWIVAYADTPNPDITGATLWTLTPTQV